MQILSAWLLACAVVHGALGDKSATKSLLASSGWQEMDARGNPVYKELAAKAATSYTKDVDFYLVLKEVETVEKKVP
ncbi:hypothetical protein V5799_017052 [Amblyomma americanum]|uniref:Secreted protein n=1 Tax=Amblyomma americanum TaxID=6943 RepID=A0AAQ4F3C9_AMBAM